MSCASPQYITPRCFNCDPVSRRNCHRSFPREMIRGSWRSIIGRLKCPTKWDRLPGVPARPLAVFQTAAHAKIGGRAGSTDLGLNAANNSGLIRRKSIYPSQPA